MMNDSKSLERLCHAVLEGTASEAELEQLKRLLHSNPAACKTYSEQMQIHALLTWQQGRAAVPAPAVLAPTDFAPTPRNIIPFPLSKLFPLRGGVLAAAAAGIVFGMFCASVMFAYVAPLSGKAVTLLQESFESGPAPQATGVPTEPGVWSGDYSEIVGEQQGVKPVSGQKMLRFLRPDYEGKESPGGNIGEVFRIVDLRGYEAEIVAGDAVVSAEAAFRCVPYARHHRFTFGLTVFALDDLPAPENLKPLLRPHWSTPGANDSPEEASLAVAQCRGMLLRAGTEWQRAATELRLPPTTRFLMVRLHVAAFAEHTKAEVDNFAGHYADDLQIVLIRRPLFAHH